MKKKIYSIVLNLVFLIVFNLLFFLLKGSDTKSSVWISYGFIHVAYLILICMHFLTPQSSFHAVLDFSTTILSVIYFITELVLGVFFILLNFENYIAPLVIQVFVFAVFLIIILLTLIKNEDTAQSVLKHEEAVFFIKEASSRIKRLIGIAASSVVDNRLSRTYDLLNNSPAKSIEMAKRYEYEIFEEISKLTESINNGDVDLSLKLLNKINILVSDRNNVINRSN